MNTSIKSEFNVNEELRQLISEHNEDHLAAVVKYLWLVNTGNDQDVSLVYNEDIVLASRTIAWYLIEMEGSVEAPQYNVINNTASSVLAEHIVIMMDFEVWKRMS